MIEAKIIADSINSKGKRITSFVVTMPRIVLAELNTHRAFSRNSASSRAIPFIKMVDAVKANPFIPIAWMKDHSGMQGNEYFTSESETSQLRDAWLSARDFAVESAENLSKLGLTKQFVNRVLEPFMWHTVILTSCDFENFTALRAHDAAEIHIQKLAFLMLEELNNSIPKKLQAGEWHIPFGDNMDEAKIVELLSVLMPIQPDSINWHQEQVEKIKVKIAVARCARVSYTVVGEEGKVVNYDADVKLHDRLLSMGHLSPFEHCAQATDNEEWSGNFAGFTQYRKTLPEENKKDSRLLSK